MATRHDDEEFEDGPLSEPCTRCEAGVGEPCDPWCVNADPYDSTDGSGGIGGYPDTLIDGILGGGL
ncbi:hypothetical protein ACFVWN_00965 [Nocardiopsis flavescens]|uniref:hypothetical protein n=1 Tax=Nocardiopsis flavescens TaxID=758803 RepID=UPI00365E4052